jgi:hypothetical protein
LNVPSHASSDVDRRVMPVRFSATSLKMVSLGICRPLRFSAGRIRLDRRPLVRFLLPATFWLRRAIRICRFPDDPAMAFWLSGYPPECVSPSRFFLPDLAALTGFLRRRSWVWRALRSFNPGNGCRVFQHRPTRVSLAPRCLRECFSSREITDLDGEESKALRH